VESELCRSKSACVRQTQDFARQCDELLRSRDQQLGELRAAAELEQERLTNESMAQAQLLRAEKDKELLELRQTAKQQADNDAKVPKSSVMVPPF